MEFCVLVWPIFFFVVIGRDIELKLILWRVLNAVFFIVEVILFINIHYIVLYMLKSTIKFATLM